MSDDYGVFCECDIDGYSSFSTVHIRTAKKRHKCDECHGPIIPGDRYEYAAGKQEGEMWDSKTCPRCLALIDWIKAHVPCFCRLYGGLFEDERMPEMVEKARETPGFAFGILRRIVAIERAKRAPSDTTGAAK